MLDKLISLFNRLCEAIAVYLLAYFNGKEAAEHEQAKAENEKLKQGLNAAVNSDTDPDSVRDWVSKNGKP